MRLLALLFLALVVPVHGASTGPQQVSVASCGADPKGQVDSTAAFAQCLTRLPAGDLYVPYGTYKISGTIVKNRNQNLVGEGSKASILQCQSTAACIVAADTTGGPNNYAVSAIRNLGIEGPGQNGTSIGVYLGGDPKNVLSNIAAFGETVNLVDVRVTGFQYGIEWGNNAYLNKIVDSLVFNNGTALYAPGGLSNSGEAIGVTDSAIFNNAQYGIDDSANFEWMLQGTSFDYNAVAVHFFGATIHATNCHFEQNTAPVFFQPSGYANLSLHSAEIIIQASTGQDTYILSTWPQSLNLSVDNVSIWANHPVQYFMKAQGVTTGTVTDLYGNGNQNIKAFADAANSLVLPMSLPFP